MAFLNILYEDDSIIVCVKPAGVATESRDIRSKDMVSLLKTHLIRQQRKSSIRSSAEPYLGMIHRLDQPVEGILVFAKTKEAAATLSKQITTNQIEKYYYAVLCRYPDDKKEHLEKKEKDDGSIYIKDLITKTADNNALIVTGQEASSGTTSEDIKASELEYRILDTRDEKVLVRVHLITGRYHQIRATMSYLNSPIVGDVRYGAPDGEVDKGTISLCSYQLSLTHPITKEKMSFSIVPSGSEFGLFQDVMK